MIPNIHIHEEFLFERHREVLREVEQRRILKGVHRQRFIVPRRMAGTLGMLLIALGTHLKWLEPGREPVMENLG
jgi:hypothetical protein